MKKGMRIAVDGMLTYNKYTDKQGVERISAEIIAEDLYVFNLKQNTQQSIQAQPMQFQPTQAAQPTQVNNYQQQGAPFPPPTDDDLPF